MVWTAPINHVLLYGRRNPPQREDFHQLERKTRRRKPQNYIPMSCSKRYTISELKNMRESEDHVEFKKRRRWQCPI